MIYVCPKFSAPSHIVRMPVVGTKSLMISNCFPATKCGELGELQYCRMTTTAFLTIQLKCTQSRKIKSNGRTKQCDIKAVSFGTFIYEIEFMNLTR